MFSHDTDRSALVKLPIDKVCDRLQGVRPNGVGWQARCPVPVHGRGRGDRNPSLSIREADGGGTLLHCHAGCLVIDVCRALGLDVDGLFPQGRPPAQGPSDVCRDWTRLAADMVSALSAERCAQLANTLCVAPSALIAVGAGWDPKRGLFTFPERAAQGSIIGVATRHPTSGKKGFLRGGKRGLTLPAGWDQKGGPLLVFEGPSDVAAALTMGINAIGRSSNHGGGDHLAELGRNHDFVIVADNDRPGHAGAIQLATDLAGRLSRGVSWTAPPSDENDVRKWLGAQCLDLGNAEALSQAGRRLLDILQSNTAVIEPKPIDRHVARYRETPDGIIRIKPTAGGAAEILLTNYQATITSEVTYDDGAEQRRFLELEASVNGTGRSIRVSAAEFNRMNWPLEHLGAEALTYPGQTTKDHARAAIQILSRNIRKQIVFSHTGWRCLHEQWFYLHGGGAIGPAGFVPDIQTDLPGPLLPFTLPTPPVGDHLRTAIRASLRMLELGPIHVLAPVFAAIFRSVLCPTDFSVYIAGETGAFKTELAALAQQHFGAGFDARHLPGSWSSTANQLEVLAFSAKDALMVVDDFAPCGTAADVARLHREADRLLRAQGNRCGRGRLRQDGSLRPVKPPRGTILSTGEDIPNGSSLRARLLMLELTKGDIGPHDLGKMQAAAGEGLLAAALSAYVRWLAPCIEGIRTGLRDEITQLRNDAGSFGHLRTPEIIAHLACGARRFLVFAEEACAISDSKRDELGHRVWEGLITAGKAQAGHLRHADPVDRFFELLGAAITSGRGHIADRDGGPPTISDPSGLGWRRGADREQWQSQGDLVGWIEPGTLCLIPEAAYSAAQAMLRGSADGLVLSAKTLWKRFRERGLLTETEDRRNTAKRTFGGRRLRVLCLNPSALGVIESGQSGPFEENPVLDDDGSDPSPEECPDSEGTTTRTGPVNGPEANSERGSAPDSPIAPLVAHDPLTLSGRHK